MAKKMLIDATHPEETRVVVADGNKIDDFDFESINKRQLAGNIYLAKVTRVEPSLQAAFVEYGGNRHGFLAFSEIHPDYYQIPVADREALLAEEEEEARRANDEEADEAERKPARGRRRRGRKDRGDEAKSAAPAVAGLEVIDVEPAETRSPDDASGGGDVPRGLEIAAPDGGADDTDGGGPLISIDLQGSDGKSEEDGSADEAEARDPEPGGDAVTLGTGAGAGSADEVAGALEPLDADTSDAGGEPAETAAPASPGGPEPDVSGVDATADAPPSDATSDSAAEPVAVADEPAAEEPEAEASPPSGQEAETAAAADIDGEDDGDAAGDRPDDDDESVGPRNIAEAAGLDDDERVVEEIDQAGPQRRSEDAENVDDESESVDPASGEPSDPGGDEAETSADLPADAADAGAEAPVEPPLADENPAVEAEAVDAPQEMDSAGVQSADTLSGDQSGARIASAGEATEDRAEAPAEPRADTANDDGADTGGDDDAGDDDAGDDDAGDDDAGDDDAGDDDAGDASDDDDDAGNAAEADDGATGDESDGRKVPGSSRRRSRRRRSRSRKDGEGQAADGQGSESQGAAGPDSDASGDDDQDDSDDRSVDEPEQVGAEDTMEEAARLRSRLRRRYKIQDVIKVRQIMLVQVVKEERGNKGAALTTYLSLAGRYCVLMPNTARGGGISRKITNATDRKRLREVTGGLDVPKGMGLIVRTAGAEKTKPEIKRDYEFLIRQWEQIRELTLKSIAPTLIYEEGSLIKRSIRDIYNKEIEQILVEGEAGYREAKEYMKMLLPSHAKNVQPYGDPIPLFSRFQVESYLNGMFNPTVQLKSGGYIVIGVTEALVAIDVNSGRATKQGSIEETALQTNLEAADEIARQLRLRDLAGLIVIDFIDMDENRNNRSVEKRMKDRLKNDRARIQVGRISAFGLMEMSRQRLRPGMLEATTQPCPACHGTGLIRSDESLALSILREVEEEGLRGRADTITVRVPVDVANYLINSKRHHIAQIEERHGVTVAIMADGALHSPHFEVDRSKNQNRRPMRQTEVVTAASVLGDEEQVEAEANTGNDDEGRSQRRRGRRGGKRRREDQRPDAEAGAADAGAVEAPAEADEETDPGDDDDQRRGRRRGRRRGGRNRRNRGEDRSDDIGAAAEFAQPPAEGAEQVAELSTDGNAGVAGDAGGIDAPAEEAAENGSPPDRATSADDDPRQDDPRQDDPGEGVTGDGLEADAPDNTARPDDADSVPAGAPPVTDEGHSDDARIGAEAAAGLEVASGDAVSEPADAPPAAETVASEAPPDPDAPPRPKRRGWWAWNR